MGDLQQDKVFRKASVVIKCASKICELMWTTDC